MTDTMRLLSIAGLAPGFLQGTDEAKRNIVAIRLTNGHGRLCLRFVGNCYRARNPKWSFTPLSGEGAAIHGGRFNPKGVPALYLGLTIEGAIIEASQGFAANLEPLTICLYEDIVDLSTVEGRSCAGISLEDMACAWALEAAETRKPA